MSSSPTMSRSNPNKPHVMCIPYPMQGHINPMLNLAEILHSLDFHITFVNTEFIHNHLTNSGALKSFSNLPNFHFEIVPDCHPPLLATTAQDYYFLHCRFAREKFLPSLHHLITRLNWCKTVTCIVSDGLMPFNIMIARELGIPGFLFWVPNACAFMGYLQEKCLIPAKDEQQDLVLDSTSVLKNIRLSDIPHGKIYENDFPTREAEEAFQAAGIIFDTFEALEQDFFNAIKPMFQHVHAIGPVQMLLNSTSDGTSNHLKSVSFDPSVDELHCLKWLDSMKPNSVLYISFGDLVVMTAQQLCEFALGICNSNHPFLWIMRPDFVKGQLATLPLEFLEKTKERGLIATWCPHEQVLTHPSVGVFVSHFGTSSMLESISAGVPLIGWPCYGDHEVSCRFSCNQWGIGMKINEDVKREEVESLVRELMEGDKGKEMKRKVMEWKKLAVEATSQGGSSEKNFDNLVLQALSGTQNLMAATYRRREIMEVVVTSRDTIKPSRPTPQHLRHVPLSFFDRIMYRVFIPMIYFYSKGSKKGDIIKATNRETSNHLKTSLAETLVKFYPLAGRVKEYHTECNDQGVPYFEAQAKCQLSQVVGESCLAKLNKLLPYAEQAGDLPLAIQVTFFDCGGIAIGTCFSHKVVDASSWSSFLNYWAAVTRGDHRSNINLSQPSFDLANLFPPIEKQISYGTTNCTSSVARRFVLSASALSAIRLKYKIPMSRGEALAAFIWTRFLASGKGKDASPESPWLAYHAVDLRTRMDPPLSEYHIGNLVGFARVGSSMDAAMKNDYAFIKKSRDATTRVDDKFVKNLQKAEFASRYLQSTKDEHASSLCFSSLSKFPLYDADFGWGRPAWVTMSGLYTLNSLVFLPTRSGDGIEVLLYLKEDDMAKLEADKEFLEFVSPPSGVKNQILSSL